MTHYILGWCCWNCIHMMTSSNGNTGPLWGESTGDRWIPLTKASDAELWCFFMYTWTNAWASSRDTGGLRPRHAYCNVTTMKFGKLNCVVVYPTLDYKVELVAIKICNDLTLGYQQSCHLSNNQLASRKKRITCLTCNTGPYWNHMMASWHRNAFGITLCVGYRPVIGVLLSQMEALLFSLLLAWTSSSTNSPTFSYLKRRDLSVTPLNIIGIIITMGFGSENM